MCYGHGLKICMRFGYTLFLEDIRLTKIIMVGDTKSLNLVNIISVLILHSNW